jgi:hypothetical protein
MSVGGDDSSYPSSVADLAGLTQHEPEARDVTSTTMEHSPIEMALRRNRIPALRRIGIVQTDTTVVLTGTVPTYYLKQLAQEAVLSLVSGKQLLNQVEVIRD